MSYKTYRVAEVATAEHMERVGAVNRACDALFEMSMHASGFCVENERSIKGQGNRRPGRCPECDKVLGTSMDLDELVMELGLRISRARNALGAAEVAWNAHMESEERNASSL